MIICPSILEKSATNYIETIKKLSPYFSYFQIDIADGKYVENKTACLDEVLFEIYKNNFSNLVYDFHLMVKNFKDEIKKIVSFKEKITINNILIHFDLSPDLQQLINRLYKNIGLVINPRDHILNLAKKYNLKNIPFIQIMSVNPGKQGQHFLKQTLKKIEQLRYLGYRSKIFLDGGINDKTFPLISKQKFLPDVICPGSYFTNANIDEFEEKIKKLKK